MRNLLLLSILGAAALTGPVASAQDAQCIFNTHGQSTVAVEYTYTTKSDGTGRETGSGFIVSRSGHVLTNAHVVKPRGKDLEVVSSSITVRVGGLGSDPIPATVAPGDIDESTDLALIKIPRIASAPWAAVPVGVVDSLPVGSLLVGLGFPANGDLALVPAAPKTANTARVDGEEKAWWQTNLALSKGNSGGPIFGKLGTVVGIAVAINRNSDFLTYVIPIARAQPLLKKAGVNGVVSGPCADFPACRHASHDIERYEINETIGDESEWRYGGGNPKANQPSWCSDLLGQLQSKYPQSSFTQVTSREREGFDNALLRTGAKYKYYCEYRRLERPDLPGKEECSLSEVDLGDCFAHTGLRRLPKGYSGTGVNETSIQFRRMTEAYAWLRCRYSTHGRPQQLTDRFRESKRALISGCYASRC